MTRPLRTAALAALLALGPSVSPAAPMRGAGVGPSGAPAAVGRFDFPQRVRRLMRDDPLRWQIFGLCLGSSAANARAGRYEAASFPEADCAAAGEAERRVEAVLDPRGRAAVTAAIDALLAPTRPGAPGNVPSAAYPGRGPRDGGPARR